MAKSSVANGKHVLGTEELPSRYYVASGQGGGWLVFREGSPRAVQRLSGKGLAIRTAAILARINMPSQVMVEQRDGSFVLKYSYGRDFEPGMAVPRY